MRELIERLEQMSEAQMDQLDRLSLGDFQRLSADATRQIGLAVNSILALKGAYDKFDEIPKDEVKRYDSLQPMLSKLGQLKQQMHNVEMQLKRMR